MTNSLSWICLIIKIDSEIKKDRGINFGAIPKRFNREYLKYVPTGYPLSTIKSKKLTDLTVRAISDRPNKITKKFFIISMKKFR